MGNPSYFVIILIVILIIIIIFTLFIILYISKANTLLITRLLFIELQWIKLLLNSNSLLFNRIDLFAKTIPYLIWELKFLLFTNNLSTKTNNLTIDN